MAVDNTAQPRGLLGQAHRFRRHQAAERALVSRIGIEQTNRQHQILDFLLGRTAERREISARGDAAGAGSHHGDILAAGNLARRVDGFVERCDVGVQPPVAMGRRRVAPTHGKGLDSVLEQKADHALVRRQVERVVLVDLRRRDQQRPPPDGRRHRCVLYQLEQFVTEHDRTWGGREIFADFEGAGVHHRRHAAIPREVVEIILQSEP